MALDPISPGTYESVWVSCDLRRSNKPDEVVVRIVAEDTLELPVFYVHVDLVEPKNLPTEGFVEGRVQALLLEEQNGTAIVEVSGEPLSYGPKIFVAKELIVR